MKLNKKQKRTATIASMAALLAVVLGMGGQTFAKYTETHVAKTGQATVAEFGFVVTTNVDNLFGTQYGRQNTEDAYATIANKDGKISVKGADSTVAPGTSGYMTISVDGISEVSAELTIALTAFKDVFVEENSIQIYNPIRWTLEEGSNKVFENLKTAEIADELADYSVSLEPAQSVSKKFTLTWTWDFSIDDAMDTVLGHAANGKDTGYTCGTTLSADFNVTIEQTKAYQ